MITTHYLRTLNKYRRGLYSEEYFNDYKAMCKKIITLVGNNESGLRKLEAWCLARSFRKDV